MAWNQIAAIVMSLISLAFAGLSIYYARRAKREADEMRKREEDLRLARIVWPNAKMGTDGVISVNMAECNRLRGYTAPPPGSTAAFAAMAAACMGEKGD